MSKARDLADYVSAGGILTDGIISVSEINDLTATAAELNTLDGITATVTELNYVDGVTSNVQTQMDTKAPVASPTFTGTATAPTINASTSLQIGGVAVTSTAAELNILDGVTSTAAELNILDGVTATTAELNYLDITTLGTSEASKVVTADANGIIIFDNGTAGESTTITSTANAATLNLRDGDNFVHTLTENVTYTFSNPPSSGKVSVFTLKIVQDTTARTITWPASVDWKEATAPTISTGSGQVDIFVFMTNDGGTTYYGFTAGQNLS